MANYNVGNIEISATAKTNDTIAKLDKIIDKLQEVKDVQSKSKSSQSGVNKELDKTKTKIDKNANSQKKHKQEVDNTKKSMSSLSSSLKGIFNLGKLYALVNYTKRFITFTVRLITYASDYVEILNKFQVSFGKLTDENLQFVEKLSSAYGFSKSTLMDYQATFNNMLKSLEGLTDETSAQLSRTLTQMAIDYSSLFNQSIESTMLAFQSMLSGSIRPIRSVSGFDVSETSIFAVYQELGGTKTMRQLTQLEKRLLRIIAVQKQMQEVGAVGDFYRTIETFSNQVKILQEQLKEFGATWGKLFLVKLKPAIQYINGLLMALNEIGKAITKNIDLVGDFNIDDEFAGFEKVSNDTDEFTESVDKLNSSLTQLGLDQLNVLGGSKGGVSSMLEIDPAIRNGLSEYVSNLDKVNMKAKEISKSVLEWAGFVYNAETQTWSFGQSLETTQEKIDYFGEKLNEVFDKTFTNLFNKKSDIQDFLSGIIYIFYEFQNSLISSINDNMPQLISFIGDIMSSLVQSLGENIPKLLEKMGELIATIIDNLPQLINEAVNVTEDLIPALVKILETIGKFLFEKAFNPEYVKKLVFNFVKAVVLGSSKILTDIFNVISEKFKEFVKPIENFFVELWEKWVGLWKKFGEPIRKIFIEPISKFFVNMINGIISGFEKFINIFVKTINSITSGLSKIWTWLGIPEIPQLKEVKFSRISIGEQSTPNVGMSEDYSSITTNPSSGKGTLTETFMEATVPMANAILQGNNEIVRTLKQQRTTLNVNGRELAEATYDDMNEVSLRKGELEIKKQI